jgi:intracellular septation protein
MKRSSLSKFFELMPVVAFFLAYLYSKNFKTATTALVALSGFSFFITWYLNRKITQTQIITTVLVIIFGTLSIINDDPYFLKIKVSILNLIWALVLLIDLLVLKKNFLKKLFGSVLDWPLHAWRSLSVSWIFFFISCVIINEAVWRNCSEAFWVYFKLFGLVPITIIFTLISILYTRYRFKL